MKQAVYQFVRVGALGRGGGSPLHLACARDSSSVTFTIFKHFKCLTDSFSFAHQHNHLQVGRYPICVFPSVPAISLLLECGADPNAVDSEGNTALHTAALNKPAKPAVIQALLDHGAHFDRVNNDKKAFANLLNKQPLHEVNHHPPHHHGHSLPTSEEASAEGEIESYMTLQRPKWPISDLPSLGN